MPDQGHHDAMRLLDDRSRLADEEYAALVGYFRMLAQLLDVFDVGAPAQ